MVASKAAAIGYGVMALFSLLFCMKVLTKSHLYHHRYDLRIWIAKLKGDKEGLKEYKDKRKRQKEKDLSQSRTDGKHGTNTSDKDLMASADL